MKRLLMIVAVSSLISTLVMGKGSSSSGRSSGGFRSSSSSYRGSSYKSSSGSLRSSSKSSSSSSSKKSSSTSSETTPTIKKEISSHESSRSSHTSSSPFLSNPMHALFLGYLVGGITHHHSSSSDSTKEESKVVDDEQSQELQQKSQKFYTYLLQQLGDGITLQDLITLFKNADYQPEGQRQEQLAILIKAFEGEATDEQLQTAIAQVKEDIRVQKQS